MKEAQVVDRILSVCAIVTAVAAVAVSVYEAHIDRQHARISVCPYVSQNNSMPDIHGPFHRRVQNAGIGPALVRGFEVRVDGRPMQTWPQAIRALTAQPPPPGQTYGSVGDGTVLVPGQTAEILTIPGGPAAVAFYVQTMKGRLSTRVCYCSLYGECWLSDSEAGSPQPVDACRVDPKTQFQQ